MTRLRWLRALFAQPERGELILKQLLSFGGAVNVTVEDGARTLVLFLDPETAVLLVSDPDELEGGLYRWRRFRRLVLRDLLLRDESRRDRPLSEIYPFVAQLLKFPRPSLQRTSAFPALSQLVARSHARLEISEGVTFDRRALPWAETLDEAGVSALRSEVAAHLSSLTSDQVAAMVQDDLFDLNPTHLVPTVFPIENYNDIAALIRHANPKSRPTVSIVLPTQAVLSVALGAGAAAQERPAEVALLYLELTPWDVMNVIRSNDLIENASAVLETNGLSLTELAIRENRFDSLRGGDAGRE